MEIGTTTISTAEYMELRAMKDNLEARKAEIEANADKIRYTQDLWFGTTTEYIGKDQALVILSMEIQKNDPAKIDRSPRGRLHFLFTGELFKTKW